MLLATSQDITDAIIIAGGDPDFDPDDLIDFTFDTVYASNSGTAFLRLHFTCGDNQTYIAIAGHNIGSTGSSLYVLNHGINDVDGYQPIDDRPIMISIPPRSGGAQDIQINIIKGNASDVIVMAHVACGSSTDLTSNSSHGQEVSKDYQAGYARIPMGLNRKVRSTLNDKAAPTAMLIKTVSAKLRLNINDVPVGFASVELLAYQRFWVENGFFIQNDDDITQSYLAFDFMPMPPKAHSSTRELVNLSYSFSGYNGQ